MTNTNGHQTETNFDDLIQGFQDELGLTDAEFQQRLYETANSFGLDLENMTTEQMWDSVVELTPEDDIASEAKP